MLCTVTQVLSGVWSWSPGFEVSCGGPAVVPGEEGVSGGGFDLSAVFESDHEGFGVLVGPGAGDGAGLGGVGVGVPGGDLVSGLDVLDRFRAAVGHEDGGVAGEAGGPVAGVVGDPGGVIAEVLGGVRADGGQFAFARGAGGLLGCLASGGLEGFAAGRGGCFASGRGSSAAGDGDGADRGLDADPAPVHGPVLMLLLGHADPARDQEAYSKLLTNPALTRFHLDDALWPS